MSFSDYKRKEAKRSLGHDQYSPQGHGWQDLLSAPLDIVKHQPFKLWASLSCKLFPF